MRWGSAVLIVPSMIALLVPFLLRDFVGIPNPPPWLYAAAGPALLAGTILTIIAGWLAPARTDKVDIADWLAAVAAAAVAAYLLFNLAALQFRAGVMPTQPDFLVSLAGVLLILECTRRLAGLALVIIAIVFIVYAFIGPWLPGFLAHTGYTAERFFSYLYTDSGILGPTVAVSSTYIILFICFAAFLQASKVGDYFVNFAFASAGHARGGPAKVAIFASGLMGMINGTSAGNVVATGSLTIPLMKKVGYQPKSAAGIEAAASTGGQIMPPIMGAGAFIMAEVTGIRYTEIAVAAVIPAVLYFISIYFMVDLEAQRTGMKGLPRDQLPRFNELVKQAYLFIPIIILIIALFHRLLGDPRRHAVAGRRHRGELADAASPGARRHRPGVQPHLDHGGAADRRLRLRRHHRRRHRPHRRRLALLVDAARRSPTPASSWRCSSPWASRSCSAWACRPRRPMRWPPRWWLPA